ncbi:Methionine ABC transporter ATP-binding protein [Actinokineospora spheciospongiae]|uniref:Methionine ABC transporter ATP-binding protein n=1 Tax=Actinokineospora spheciospongiae TaxID=909613 RepID=W7IU75_9PSEU|nr:ABC transporter ATP-binding protein [Actinokineospora spheciospongiae]EWC64480.1 Methionine ABC transporter ATP-binding protein [Actinokineospora spheciospongiae]
MTSRTTTGQATDRPRRAAPEQAAASTLADDQEAPFDQDRLPTPPGSSRALLASLLRPHSRRLWASALLVLLQQGAVQSGPLLVVVAIDTAVPALRGGDPVPLLSVAVAYLLTAVLAGGAQYAFVRQSGRVSQDVLLGLRTRIFRQLQDLSVDFHDRYTSGRVISRSTADVENLRGLVHNGLQDLVEIALSTLYISAVLLYLDWQLGVAALASTPVLVRLVRSLQRRSMRAYRRKSTATASVVVKLAETLNGIRTVRAFRRERANDAAFDVVNRRHELASGDASLEMTRYIVFSRLVADTAVAVLMLWSAYRVATGMLELGVLAGAVLYLRRLYDPIDRLGMLLNSYQAAAASLEKIAGLLLQRPGVPPPATPVELPVPRGPGPGRALVVEAASFAYRTGGEVLPRTDLALRPGSTVAVVGATGAGKSTLAKLLARFHDPTTGRVLLDGIDLRDLTDADLRRAVVIVAQEPFLFSGTVSDNIEIGRPGATREQVVRAAEAVGAHAFITALPDGYDTDLRARGGRISAGQRQLVSFARVLLADPAVLILDEATGSLDLPGERAVQYAMRTALHGRTAVVIAHRLSTAETADRVLVMADGRIVEDGAPADLVAAGGRFADMYRAWNESLR